MSPKPACKIHYKSGILRTQGVLFSLLLFCFFISAFTPFNLSGTVVKVIDGDSIQILVNKKTYEIRLFGIDCPELRGQPYGRKAKKFTSKWVYRRSVDVRVVDQDDYGRSIGIVYLDNGHTLNAKLIGEGYAWWNRKYAPHNAELKTLEQEARQLQKGLWKDPKPVPPWKWRRLHKP